MKVYKQRKGIVFADVCGQYLLAASKEAREHCPYISQINETSAFIWSKLDSRTGVSESKLMELIASEYEIEEPDNAERTIRVFLDSMAERGYIIASEDDYE